MISQFLIHEIRRPSRISQRHNSELDVRENEQLGSKPRQSTTVLENPLATINACPPPKRVRSWSVYGSSMGISVRGMKSASNPAFDNGVSLSMIERAHLT
jgi:hypothetical protein